MRTQIQGRCPACGWSGSIFVGEAGYLTCSRDTCPNPCAPSEALGVKFANKASAGSSANPPAIAGERGTELPPGDSDALMEALAHLPGTRLVVAERVAALRATIVELSDALAEVRATSIESVAHAWRHVSEAESERDTARANLAALAADMEAGESPHVAAKWWRERQALRDEVARLTAAEVGHDAEREVLATTRAEVERLKASIALKDDAILTAMRNLVANDATIKRLRGEVNRLTATVANLRTGKP